MCLTWLTVRYDCELVTGVFVYFMVSFCSKVENISISAIQDECTALPYVFTVLY